MTPRGGTLQSLYPARHRAQPGEPVEASVAAAHGETRLLFPYRNQTRAIVSDEAAALRLRLPQEPSTQLIDLTAATDGDLQAILELAQGYLAVVRLHLHYDVAYRAEQPPQPLDGLETRVLKQAHELVRQHVRGCDLTTLVGHLDIAVLLLRAGPLEARAQAGRLRARVAEQRFELEGYEVCWRARAGLAAHQPGPAKPPIRQLFEELLRAAK